jgi:hypothetical protein
MVVETRDSWTVEEGVVVVVVLVVDMEDLES